jgi:hypothetical protein
MTERTRGGLARAIETLRTDLPSDPDALRRYALDLIAEVAEASCALWYELGMVKGDPYPVRHTTRPAPGAMTFDIPITRQSEEERNDSICLGLRPMPETSFAHGSCR